MKKDWKKLVGVLVPIGYGLFAALGYVQDNKKNEKIDQLIEKVDRLEEKEKNE